jgi:hypothetical protein
VVAATARADAARIAATPGEVVEIESSMFAGSADRDRR